jgi:hypothetical protein
MIAAKKKKNDEKMIKNEKNKKIFPPIHHLDSNNAFILNLSKTSFTTFLGSQKAPNLNHRF